MQSREYGKHNRPHVHVNAGDRYSAAIDILTGEILAGEIPGKYMKQIKNIIANFLLFEIFLVEFLP